MGLDQHQEHHPQGDLEPDDASPLPAADEEAARFSEKSESSASRIKRVCHDPVDIKTA